ncbi:MAG TPA: PIN domain-containing protein [Candidatus Bathyarchaeia archaeon]|nr:PIN domain-containing protein [Candidatus Bathyarchaeia archaeon]
MRSGEKIPDTIYDTRFFLAAYAKEAEQVRRLRSELQERKRRFVSAITIHEIYRITLEEEGREVAKIRRAAIERDFEVVDVDSEIATESAEIKVAQGRDFPLADSIIGTTAKLRKLVCFTDDEHIKSLRGIKTRWF